MTTLLPTTHVVMFSGGKGSWGAARYLRDVDGVDPAHMRLLFTDTNGEDPDLYRFLVESAADVFGVELPDWWDGSLSAYREVVELVPGLVVLDNDGRTVWDVFHDQRMIGNARLSVCSRALKQRPARAWLKDHTDPEVTTVVVGIDWTETHRLPAIERSYAPWPAVAPLCERGAYSKAHIDDLLARAGIAEPRLYGLGFPHNNCAGACVRAGQAQWATLYRTNPARFLEEEAQERTFRAEVGKDVAILTDRRGGTRKPMTLEQLRERVEAEDAAQPSLLPLVDADDVGGCGCMTDLATPEEEVALLGGHHPGP